ncbi:MAG: diguanylate cyclase [Wolinella sp.]
MIMQRLINKTIPLAHDASLRDAFLRIQSSGCGTVVFVDEGNRPIAIITERDISRLLFSGHTFDESALELANNKGLIFAQGERDLEHILELMIGNNIRRVIICDSLGRYIGIVTQDTIFHELGEEIYKTKLRAKHIIGAKNFIFHITNKESLKDALSIMVQNRIGTLPILDKGGKTQGIITEQRIIKLAESGVDLDSKASDFASHILHVVHEDSYINDIIDIFEKDPTSLCVLVNNSNGELQGIVTKRDLLKNAENSYKTAMEESFRATRYALNNFPQSVLECYHLGTTILIQWANRRAFEIFGDDILDKPLSVILDPMTNAYILSCIAKGLHVKPFNIKVHGNYYELTVAKSTQRIIQFVFTDVTKHKEYEETLQKEQKVVQNILDFQSSIVFVTDGDEITNVNKSCLDFFGLNNLRELKSRYKCLSQTFVARDGFLARSSSSWLQKAVEATSKKSSVKAILQNPATKEERIFIIKAGAYPDSVGKFIVSLTDITELEESKQELEKKVQDRTADLSHTMHILQEAQKIARLGYWQLHLNSMELEYSGNMIQAIGIKSSGKIDVKDLMDIVYPSDRLKLIRAYINATSNNQDVNCIIRFLGLHDNICTTRIHIKSPSSWYNKRILFGICQDITEQTELEKAAYYDSLTRIYNRNKFNDLISREIDLFKRYKQPLSLLIFDIDHFKLVNDTYGHQVGDMVLSKIADIVSHEIRSTDIFARWGGEEFVIITPETSLDGARLLAEKLRAKIESWEFKNIDGHITCSFGVTNILSHEEMETSLNSADELLYQAKDNGRNCVVALER